MGDFVLKMVVEQAIQLLEQGQGGVYTWGIRGTPSAGSEPGYADLYVYVNPSEDAQALNLDTSFSSTVEALFFHFINSKSIYHAVTDDQPIRRIWLDNAGVLDPADLAWFKHMAALRGTVLEVFGELGS